MSLFWRIFTMHAGVLITDARLLTDAPLFRFRPAPLRRLNTAMAADLVRPGTQPKAAETVDLVQTPQAMRDPRDRVERTRYAVRNSLIEP
ncbi:hypothetical protein ACIRUY_17675 [Streptomyces erythrochromogenes]|uniref:hypothetical protein n=1 Tax=Streptomyces erythrochromogenes TaxID=285574 RepID=UPI00381FD071